jgi:hypothetical protein
MERESHHMMTPNVLWSAPEEELLRTIQQVRWALPLQQFEQFIITMMSFARTAYLPCVLLLQLLVRIDCKLLVRVARHASVQTADSAVSQ